MSKLPTLAGLDNAQLGHITNGCGGGLFDVPDWIFFDACQQHDLDYWMGCTEEDRKIADLAFYTNMKIAVAKLSWYKCWLYYGLAYIYYKGVRILTAKYFYFGCARRTLDDLAVEMGLPPAIEPTKPVEFPSPPETKPDISLDDDQIVS